MQRLVESGYIRDAVDDVCQSTDHQSCQSCKAVSQRPLAMNAVFASCLFVVVFVVAASAHHLDLCKKNDQVLATELECIRQQISPAANAAFDIAVQTLGCSDRSCAMRKMCEGNDLEKAMSKFFTAEQIQEIHNAATACDPDVHHDHQ